MSMFPVCHITKAWNCISVALHVKFLVFKNHMSRISVPKVPDSTWGNSQRVQRLLTLSALRCHGKWRASAKLNLCQDRLRPVENRSCQSQRVTRWPQYQRVFHSYFLFSMDLILCNRGHLSQLVFASGLQVKHKHVALCSLCFWNSILEC